MEAIRNPLARARANPWLAVGIALAALLVVAWLAWSIYVGSDRGVNEGLGVLIAVPALLVALALISLPFIGIYLLVRRPSPDSDGVEAETGDDADEDAEEPEEEEEPEDEEDSAADDEEDGEDEADAEEEDQDEADEADEAGEAGEEEEEDEEDEEPESD